VKTPELQNTSVKTPESQNSSVKTPEPQNTMSNTTFPIIPTLIPHNHNFPFQKSLQNEHNMLPSLAKVSISNTIKKSIATMCDIFFLHIQFYVVG
jgi:hypothetical protein